MRQILVKNWWLLASCCILDAALACILLLALSPDGSVTLRALVISKSKPELLGLLALAAGACTVAAAIRSSGRRDRWLLVLNGLAGSALGILIDLGASRPVAFRTIAFLIAPMALSLALQEWTAGRKLRGHSVDAWIQIGLGMVGIVFAGEFLGFAIGWIGLEPSPSSQTFHWLGSYFAFSALTKMELAFSMTGPRLNLPAISRRALPTS